MTLPSLARRSLVRTNAPPLPGLTCWNSRILKTVPSTSMWLPFLNWLVLIATIRCAPRFSRKGPIVTQPKPMDGYVRVSRRLGREGPGYISPRVQREAIERWAEYKGVAIAAWHVDEDETGGTQDRPGLVAGVERAVSGETGGIVSWRIDRFSRYTEGGRRALRRLQERDARLAFVVEDIDTSGPMGRFVYTVMLAMGEY